MKKKNSRSESISEEENDENLYKDDEDYDYSPLKEDCKQNNKKKTKEPDFFEYYFLDLINLIFLHI